MYYEKYRKKDLILRDLLATDRTILANERTFLAYARTALTLFVAGVSFIHFYPSKALFLIGWSFVPAAVVVVWIGFRRFVRMRRELTPLLKNNDSEDS